MASHTGISVFMSLQYEVDTIFLYQRVEHGALEQVVHASFDGVQRMMEHDDFPSCIAFLELFF